MFSINSYHIPDLALSASARSVSARGLTALRKVLAFVRGLARADDPALAPLNARLLQDIGETPASAEFVEALRAPLGSLGLRSVHEASRWPLTPLG